MAEEESIPKVASTAFNVSKSTRPLKQDIDLSMSAGTKAKAFNMAFEIDTMAKRLELTVANRKDVMLRIKVKDTYNRMRKWF